MRIYKLDFMCDKYQWLAKDDEADIKRMRQLSGTKLKSKWKAVTFYRNDMKRPTPDFFYTGTPGVFVCAAKGMPTFVQMHLEIAGELLSCKVEEWPQKMVIMNVTEIYNCLDIKKTKWHRADDGEHNLVDFKPKSHVFKPNRIGGSSLFRIPQGNSARLFCWERDGNPESEFKAAVEQSGMTGLGFKLEWEGKE